MSLTEIMSNAGLSHYAEVALVLFFAAFLFIVWRIFRPGRRADLERHKNLPLDNDSPSTPRPRGSH